MRVEQYGVRRWYLGRAGLPVGLDARQRVPANKSFKPRREIAGFQRPFDLKQIIAEFHGMIFYKFGQRGFVSGDITQFRAVFERERRRSAGVIEADETELFWSAALLSRSI